MAACGGAPSDGDIKAAIEKQTQAEAKAMEQFAEKQAPAMFKDMMPEIKSVKKIGCKEDGEKAYRCDVEIEVSQGKTTDKSVTAMRFVKSSDGWLAMK